jgi:hypothetical protein
LDGAFRSATPENEMLFKLVVTKGWLRQVIVALALICRGSCRGVIEFIRDLLGVSMSVGTVHQMLQSAARKADVINHEQDLSAIRVGLHDDLFQGAMPVLAGVDAASTYCYLLAAADHRDADTWGVHLLDASRQGLKPDYTIAEACAPGRRQPGTTRRAMAMCFTSSTNTKALPTHCRTWPRGPHHGAGSCTTGSTAPASVAQTKRLRSSWNRRDCVAWMSSETGRGRNTSNPTRYLADTDIVRASQPQHSVQGRGSDGDLGRLGLVSARPKGIADHALVAADRRLHLGPQIVAAGFLPCHSAAFGYHP